MLDIKRRIKVISDLLDLNTPESVTYAALECRLAIEYLCYDRMKMALGLASYADMGGWTPNKVIKAVEELVDEHVAEEFTIRIAKGLDLPQGQEPTQQDFEKLDFKSLGKQASLNLKQLIKLWNALSNAALHVQVPKLQTDELSIYGNASRTTEKVRDCLAEFTKIAEGTLLSNGIGHEVSITCDACGFPVRRRVKQLKDKQIVSCINPDCDESYTAEMVSEKDVSFVRRQAVFDCEDCGATNNLPLRQVENKRVSEVTETACSGCGRLHKIFATLQITKIASAD